MRPRRRRPSIWRFLALGALAFGAGGAVAGALGDLLFLGLLLQGLLGGAALGLALGSWRKSLVMALVGAAGFFVGYYLIFFIVLTIEELPLGRFVIGAYAGLTGGLALGLAVGERGRSVWANMMSMALAGALGFGIALGLLDMARGPEWEPLMAQFTQEAWGTLWLGLGGLVGGGLLGLTLWFLQRRPPSYLEYGEGG